MGLVPVTGRAKISFRKDYHLLMTSCPMTYLERHRCSAILDLVSSMKFIRVRASAICVRMACMHS